MTNPGYTDMIKCQRCNEVVPEQTYYNEHLPSCTPAELRAVYTSEDGHLMYIKFKNNNGEVVVTDVTITQCPNKQD